MTENRASFASARPIRAGVIGYGLAGRVFHCPFLKASPEFTVEFIATKDSERRAQAQEEHPGAQIVGDANELLDHASKLDLVVLASPPSVHLEQGLAALERKLPVVVDKPFAPSVEAAERLIAKAREVGKPLMVFQNRRWDGDFLTVRKIVQSGRLGEVYQFESSFEHWAPQADDRWKDQTPVALGGGVTFDLGSHLVDQALVLFGPVSDVKADVRTVRRGGGNDDVGFLELLHQSGVRSRLWMSRLGAQPGPRFRVLGTEGAYVSYGLDGQEPALADGMSPNDERYGREPEETWGTLGVSATGQPDPVRVPTERGCYPAFYEGVAAAVRGTGPVPVPVEEALEVVRILERVQRDPAVAIHPGQPAMLFGS